MNESDAKGLGGSDVERDSPAVAETSPQVGSAPPSDLETLYSMFPSLEKDVVNAVFMAQGHNIELAVASLLELSDPNTVPGAANAPPAAGGQVLGDEELARRIAQAEGDAEFARRLQYEEQRRVQGDEPAGADSGAEPTTMDVINRNLEELDQKLSKVGDRVGVAVESAAHSMKQWFGNIKTKLANNQDGGGANGAQNSQDEADAQRYNKDRFSSLVSEQDRKNHSSQYAALLDEAEDDDNDEYRSQPLRSVPLESSGADAFTADEKPTTLQPSSSSTQKRTDQP